MYEREKGGNDRFPMHKYVVTTVENLCIIQKVNFIVKLSVNIHISLYVARSYYRQYLICREIDAKRAEKYGV